MKTRMKINVMKEKRKVQREGMKRKSRKKSRIITVSVVTFVVGWGRT